jgi:hypothetical protein
LLDFLFADWEYNITPEVWDVKIDPSQIKERLASFNGVNQIDQRGWQHKRSSLIFRPNTKEDKDCMLHEYEITLRFFEHHFLSLVVDSKVIIESQTGG